MFPMFRRRTISQLIATAALLPVPAAAQGGRPPSRIAFGSCADQAQPQPTLVTMPWFLRAETWVFAWRDRLYAFVRALPAWQRTMVPLLLPQHRPMAADARTPPARGRCHMTGR